MKARQQLRRMSRNLAAMERLIQSELDVSSGALVRGAGVGADQSARPSRAEGLSRLG